MSTKLYGIALSPYVRKVRLAMALKELDYEHIPVIPASDERPQEFLDNSPLGKIPLLHIDGVWLPDSTVIMAYLEQAYPSKRLLSDDPKTAARALWFEQYTAHMSAVMSGHLFAELILAPHFFKRDSNTDEIESARNTEIPAIFDYLETQLSGAYLLGDDLGFADVCMASPLITLIHCEYQCDAGRWPKVASYIDRLLAQPEFGPIIDEERALLATVTGG